ncbi:MAG: DUF401 family protein [Lachnospiraceae bacterium]|nr:DUF401 family protein [Lachnospiraceae bacterium]
MSLIFLGIAFLTIILLLARKRPLYQAILGGLVMTALLFRIPFSAIVGQTANVFLNWGSFSVLVSLYLITYLQRMLEARDQIKLTQKDLNGLFHNRRVNAAGASLFIGLLPSAAAMILCGDIVKDATEGYLEPKEQAFVTSWFRHIPESTLPTYSGVLLLTTLSGVALGPFMLGMIIPMLVLGMIAYFPYLRKIPTDPGTPKSQNRKKDAFGLFQHLWSLLLILVLILAFKLSVVPAVAIVLVLAAIVYRFSASDLLHFTRSAFEVKLLLNSFLVLVLKEFIAYTGVLEELPALLSALPIPAYLVFALLFLVGGIVSGSQGIIALATPLAFTALNGGTPLAILLMCMCHAASMISPTHVCLVVAADYYHITMGELIRKSILPALTFAALMVGYYQMLMLFFSYLG